MTSPRHLLHTLRLWVDGDAVPDSVGQGRAFNWFRVLPFIAIHAGCLLLLVTGWSPVAVTVCAIAFFVRMFAITGFYHRYFSHRTFRTSRVMQFVFAVMGASAAQRGPLWWAAHHRHHHQHSDTPDDLHSPVVDGFWWSHAGWFTCDAAFRTQIQRIGDFARFPELRFINRFDSLIPVLMIVVMYGLGAWLEAVRPEWGTNGLQMVTWGFLVSTVLLFHGTVTINSLAHVWGTRRFDTRDNSRNNFVLALITLGEGWHNNHHRYPKSARQGFFWWEIDITYYVLWLMQSVGLIWDLAPVPAHIQAEARERRAFPRGTPS
jgi:stearoyl-CoA desaturase (delta-9 desaturase)